MWMTGDSVRRGGRSVTKLFGGRDSIPPPCREDLKGSGYAIRWSWAIRVVPGSNRLVRR